MGLAQSKLKPTVLSCVRADITTLAVQAIVNASNVSGLGCVIKNHCIDSAIHAAAGPHLLEACKKLRGIPTGVAKITPAFNLPSKFIIHVTGPQHDAKQDTPFDYDALSACYDACLNLAAKHNIRQLAFCCISTGIFGYPKKESASVAVTAVRKWVTTHPYHFTEIIFVSFDYANQEIFGELLSQCFQKTV